MHLTGNKYLKLFCKTTRKEKVEASPSTINSAHTDLGSFSQSSHFPNISELNYPLTL